MRFQISILILIFCLNLNAFGSEKNFIIYDSTNSPMEVNKINKVIIDGKNKIWFSVSGYQDTTYIANLLSFDGKIFDNHSIFSDFPLMTSFTIDSTYNPWIKYYDTTLKTHAIARRNNDLWEKYDTTDTYHVFSGMKTDCYGNIIVGTRHSITIFDKDFKIIQQFYPPRKSTKYQSITIGYFFIENCEDLWFAFGQSGLYHYKLSPSGIGEQVEWFNQTNSPLYYIDIRTFIRDSQKNLWFSCFDLDTYTDYLYKYDNQDFFIIDSVLQSFPTGYIDKNDIYITSYADTGLYKVNVITGEWTSFYTIEPDFPKCRVYNMEIDKDNNIWFGTDIGLIKYNENGITAIDDHLANKSNSSISITPNPATDYIEISFEGVMLSEAYTKYSEAHHPVVKVFDVLGIEHPATAWHPSAEGIRFL